MGLEDLIIRGSEYRGMKIGVKQGIKQVIINMLRNNFSDEMIVKIASVTPDYVNEMRMSLKN